jgi:O-antigen ligase
MASRNLSEVTGALWLKRAVIMTTALLFLVPFVYGVHREPIPTFDQELLAAVLLALAVIPLCALRKVPLRPLQVPLVSLFAALLAVSLWHWQKGSLTYNYSLQMLFMALSLSAMAYALGRTIKEQGWAESATSAITVALLIGACFNVAVQWLQMFGVAGLPQWLYFELPRGPDQAFRPTGNIAQANHVATYLALTLACIAVRGPLFRPIQRCAAITVGGLCASGIALSASRMGLLMLLALSAVVILRAIRRQVRWSYSLAFLSVMVLGFVATVLIGPLVYSEAQSAVERVGASTYGIRLVMWQDAWRVALANAAVGVGVGEYPHAQYWVAKQTAYTLATHNVHNLILQTAAEFGMPAALMMVALLVWWFCADLRERLLQPTQLLVWLMVALIMFHAMLEWPLSVMFFAVPAALLWGIGEPEIRMMRLPVTTKDSLPLLAVAVLAYVPLLFLDHRSLARSVEMLQTDRLSGMVMVLEIGDKTLFKPHADRHLLSLVSKGETKVDDETRLVENVLSRLPDPNVIAHYIYILVRAGHADVAVTHVERLRVFATSPEHFELLRLQLLDLLPEDDLQGELVRRALLATS